MTVERGQRFSEVSIKLLREAGWFPGRNVLKTIELSSRFPLLEPAIKVLEEFGHLKIGDWGPGIDTARMGVHIEPMLAAGEDDRFLDYARQIGSQLYTLGEAGGGHFFLAIDERGRVFLLMDDLFFVDDSFDSALDHLLIGKM